ncbi:MAG: alpha/beta hydrolase [Planctomycetes bacterium]|nr:alpha/beta hydrolase [Planctomycetota bacterium]
MHVRFARVAACAALLLLASCTSTTRPSPVRARWLAAGLEKVVPVGTLDVHYLEQGSGPAVVLLHGYGGSAYDWRHQLAPLAAAGFRVLAPDLKGAGYTSRPEDGHYSAEDQADLVAEFMTAIGVPRAHLVGNSYGGGVALVAALKYAPRFERLVLINSMCYAQKYPFYIWVARAPILGHLSLTLLPDRFMVGYVLHEAYYKKERIPQEVYDEYTWQLGYAGSRAALLRMAHALVPDDMEERQALIRKIPQETLVLWGRHDPIIPLAHGERLRREIVRSRLLILEDCAHVPNQEKPEVVNPLLAEFLKQGTVRGAAGAAGVTDPEAAAGGGAEAPAGGGR